LIFYLAKINILALETWNQEVRDKAIAIAKGISDVSNSSNKFLDDFDHLTKIGALFFALKNSL
jgi:hypothetical protein